MKKTASRPTGIRSREQVYAHHILPRERAQFHGIWNFAEALASDFGDRLKIESGFSNWMRFDDSKRRLIRNQEGIEDTRSRFSLWSEKNHRLLLIFHFDYGSYGSWDMPIWLWRELRGLKRAFSPLKIVLFCHESPPRYPRRRREALFLPISQRIFEGILTCSDRVLFSNPAAYEQACARTDKRLAVHWRPVFSNIGEPESSDFIGRKEKTTWIIFGSPGNLPNYLDKLYWKFDLLPEEIRPELLQVIGGGECEIVKKFVAKLRTKRLAISHYEALDNSRCAELFKNSRFLFLGYFEDDQPANPEVLMKSTVFAAANAYGVIPVINHEGFGRITELTGHPGGVCFQNGEWSIPHNLEALPELISRWYRKHSSLEGMSRAMLEALDN